jgi:O-antigen/teichoic acid export membrane protein
VVAGELVGKVATLVFTVVVARELGSSSFGSFSYALAFGMLLATLVGWGFDAELARRGSVDLADLDAALAQALTLRTLHALPVVVLGTLIGALTRPSREAAVTLALLLLASVLDSYGDAGRSAATALEQSGRAVLALVAQRVAACLLAVGLLAGGGGLIEVSAGYLLSSLLGQIVLATMLHRFGVRPQWSSVRGAALRDMWRRTVLLGLDSVLATALFRIDALMLGALASDREVAAYAVAYRLMETVLFVNWAVARSLFPAMVRAAAGPALLRVGASTISITGALLVPYGVLVYLDGAALLRLLFGDGYGGRSVLSLQLLAAAPLAFAISYFAGYLLVVQERRARVLLATIFGIVLNVALNVVLIPRYGAPGAAAATTVSYALQAALTVVLVAPGNGVLRADRACALPVAAAVPMAATLLVLHTGVIVEAALATAVYALAYLLLARWRDPEQLDLLRSVLRRG